MRDYRLIDADCHVVEPPHIWTTWLEKKFQDRAPKLVKDDEGGDAWQLVPGQPPMFIGLVGCPGTSCQASNMGGCPGTSCQASPAAHVHRPGRDGRHELRADEVEGLHVRHHPQGLLG